MQLQTNFIQFRSFQQSHENDILIIRGHRKIIILILSCKKVVEAVGIKEWLGLGTEGRQRSKPLKGNWAQSNNFCLKWSFFIIKQNDINKILQKFQCNPQLACFVCSFACMASRELRYSFKHSKLRNFTSSWKIVKNTMKLYGRIFLHKTKRKMQRKPGVKCSVHSRVWRHLG